MYGIFTYIWLNFMVNVGKYTIHGSYGFETVDLRRNKSHIIPPADLAIRQMALTKDSSQKTSTVFRGE